MHSKLAGHLPLQDLIQSTIQSARTKLAAAEENDKVKKLVAYEKKEHGGKIPSVKEEEDEHKEKTSSVIDLTDADQIEKLASALEFASEEFSKEADEKNIGGEKPQGGEVLQTASPLSGKQPYKKDSSKSHNVPASTPEGATVDNPGAANAVQDNMKNPAGLKTPYPAKGVLKTAAETVKEMIAKKKEKGEKGEAEEKGEKEKSSSVKRLQNALDKVAAKETASEDKGEKKEKETASEKKAPPFEKKSNSAVDFILGKIAESAQGGMTLDSPSETGPKPESGPKGGNDARKNISSIQAAINMKKVDGKVPQKRMLSEVLTEPALSKAHDSKVHENLRNATAGGVKIAAAKSVLAKIAADPSDPRHEALKAAIAKKKEEKETASEKKEKKSGYVGTGGETVPPASGTPTPNPM